MDKAKEQTVLVAYASKHGSTKAIADAIGRGIEESGAVRAKVRSVDEVSDVSAFGAVVLGSAVYMGRWMDTAKQFAHSNRDVLANRPVWLFSSGPVGHPLKPDENKAVHVEEIMDMTKANRHRLFGGKIDKHQLGFGERAVITAVGGADGDFRDWDEIAKWAKEIGESLTVDDHV